MENSYALQKFQLDDEDRTLGAICYASILVNLATGIFGLAGPGYVLLSQHKNKPSLKLHAIQSLVTQIVSIGSGTIAALLASFVPCAGLVIAIPFIVISLGLMVTDSYWAYKAYKGEAFSIPYITDYVLNNFGQYIIVRSEK